MENKTKDTMEKAKTVEGIPLIDPLGLIEDLTNGRGYDPLRRGILHVIQRILGMDKEGPES